MFELSFLPSFLCVCVEGQMILFFQACVALGVQMTQSELNFYGGKVISWLSFWCVSIDLRQDSAKWQLAPVGLYSYSFWSGKKYSLLIGPKTQTCSDWSIFEPITVTRNRWYSH